MSPKFWIPVAGVAGLIIVGAAGGYVYFFSGLRTTPSALTLATPSAVASSSAPAGASTSAGTGTWSVTTGSLVGYRVNEQFVGQSSTHQAVARTGDVSGQVAITKAGGAYQMQSTTITVQLANLASVDSVAGYNVTNRDRIVQQSLDVRSFPTATFTAESVTLPAGAESGQAVTVTVPGELTVHGVTKSVTATVQLRVTGSTAQIAGTIDTDMTQFGVSPPAIGFTNVQPAVTIEFSLNLKQGA
jgi:polyisoprenoid-binding protein YceI